MRARPFTPALNFLGAAKRSSGRLQVFHARFAVSYEGNLPQSFGVGYFKISRPDEAVTLRIIADPCLDRLGESV